MAIHGKSLLNEIALKEKKEGNKNVYNEDVNDRYPVSSDLKKNEIVFVKGTLSGMVIPQSKGPGEDATHLKLIPYQRNTKIICIL